MTNRGCSLFEGMVLNENEYLESNNGRYFAIFQGDHNFVIYKVIINYESIRIWIIILNNITGKRTKILKFIKLYSKLTFIKH